MRHQPEKLLVPTVADTCWLMVLLRRVHFAFGKTGSWLLVYFKMDCRMGEKISRKFRNYLKGGDVVTVVLALSGSL